jgi:DNA-binding NarL/FixJ family response regulator
MKRSHNTLFVTHDPGLLLHWQKAFGKTQHAAVNTMEALFQATPKLPCVAWIDTAIPGRPAWTSETWTPLLQNEQMRVVATSSNPRDDEAMEALDAGCVAYCHAFSDAPTLKQVREVVEGGQVWIGKSLMQRLLHNVNRVVSRLPSTDEAWRVPLTRREIEVAILAANGASNNAIATQCKISERTVKAHLSAIFDKLNITDRLQLALRVHGIQ